MDFSATDNTAKQAALTQIRSRLINPAEITDQKLDGSPAAVLIPLYQKQNQLHVVLIKRPKDMRRHPGEISFPGGKFDANLDGSFFETALRESDEEIGLQRSEIELLGAIKPLPTYTGFAVYPFVAWIEREELSWQISKQEVDEVIELPLTRLRDSAEKRHVPESIMPFKTLVYELDGYSIWGATAWMLKDLFERLQTQ